MSVITFMYEVTDTNTVILRMNRSTCRLPWWTRRWWKSNTGRLWISHDYETSPSQVSDYIPVRRLGFPIVSALKLERFTSNLVPASVQSQVLRSCYAVWLGMTVLTLSARSLAVRLPVWPWHSTQSRYSRHSILPTNTWWSTSTRVSKSRTHQGSKNRIVLLLHHSESLE